jgi:3-oxoacyl-[acyl-carrier protein] reductase
MSLTDKKAVVTGASRGIGRAIAVELARAGAQVVCASTKEGGCEGTLTAIRDAGGEAEAHVVDVADEDSVAAFAEKVLAGGSPHFLVNNSGITCDGSFLRMTAGDFDRVVAVNLRGTFLVCKAFARSMTKMKPARIVNVGSIVGLTGNAGQANYAASKAGVVGLTRSIAKEFGGRGLTANVIAPGFIETDMTADLSGAVKDEALKSVPLGRFGSPEDIAGVAAFLCSDAAAYITGQVLVVDGGMTL